MTSQMGKRILTIYILPSISRNKGNQAMKFGQLIKHKVKIKKSKWSAPKFEYNLVDLDLGN